MSSVFGYLNEFWNSVTDAVVSGTTYTVQFFQSIGNAVAGAIGSIFLTPLKVLVEVVLALGWTVSNIGTLLSVFLQPFKFLGTFFSGFLEQISNAPEQVNAWTQNGQALSFLASFPLWNTLSLVLSSLIIILGVITTIKTAKL